MSFDETTTENPLVPTTETPKYKPTEGWRNGHHRLPSYNTGLGTTGTLEERWNRQAQAWPTLPHKTPRRPNNFLIARMDEVRAKQEA